MIRFLRHVTAWALLMIGLLYGMSAMTPVYAQLRNAATPQIVGQPTPGPVGCPEFYWSVQWSDGLFRCTKCEGSTQFIVEPANHGFQLTNKCISPLRVPNSPPYAPRPGNLEMPAWYGHNKVLAFSNQCRQSSFWGPPGDAPCIPFWWYIRGDPDGDILSFWIDIWRINAAGAWELVYANWTGIPGNMGEVHVPGFAFTTREGLQPGTTYGWRVFAVDRVMRADRLFTPSVWSIFATEGTRPVSTPPPGGVTPTPPPAQNATNCELACMDYCTSYGFERGVYVQRGPEYPQVVCPLGVINAVEAGQVCRCS